MRRYISVRIIDAPYHIDHAYDYYVPEEYEEEICVGAVVTVPFGRSNKRTSALVCEVKDKSDFERVKPISSVSDPRFFLSEEMIELCFFMCEQTLCTVGEAMRCMIPAAALSRSCQVLIPSSDKSADIMLTGAESSVLNYLKEHPRSTPKAVISHIGEASEGIISKLIKNGLIIRDYDVKESSNISYDTYVSLNVSKVDAEIMCYSPKDAEIKLRSEAHKDIVRTLMTAGRLEKKELMQRTGASAAQIRSLCEKGVISEEKTEHYRNPYSDIKIDKSAKNILSDKQREAFLQLCDLYREKAPRAALLWGVTGSGKTRVMKAMIDEVTRDGRTVIVLVPEISLTPQTVSLFCSFYGERVAVLHSSLSHGERLDAYKRIKNKTVDVVIGTRSAVFAPLENIGMIIIDEEQEHTYKSDSDPKYHARDIARFRCAKNNALMLLCSATPSVESFYKAKNGTYSLICLRDRYGNAKLPEVKICDMRAELRAAHTSPLSRELIEEIDSRCKRGEQSIIFLNRRGYNNFVNCRECGETIDCPHCSVTLTPHRDRGGNDTLRCHYCGYSVKMPLSCPHCHSKNLSRMGVGTQKAAEEFSLFIPSARILRMDADTTTTKDAYDKILDSFRANEADILIGTQMVAKGHDFPDVTLVGVLCADSSLSAQDFRANERTFSLITQVAGRAGRAQKEGISIIQSFKPECEILSLCKGGDYELFYEKEIELRRSYIWPPFCDIVLMTLTASNEQDLIRLSKTMSESFNKKACELTDGIPVVAYGPFEAPIYKVNEKYRMRMIIKTKLKKQTRALFSSLLKEFGEGGGAVTLSIDFNPSSV